MLSGEIALKNNHSSYYYYYFAHSYYSQFTGKISFKHNVIGYITLLCMTSK